MLKINVGPVHVGGIVADSLEALELPIGRAAELLGVRRATLSALVNERAALTGEMALRLEKAFGFSADFLMRMQARYALDLARENDTLDIKRYEAAAA